VANDLGDFADELGRCTFPPAGSAVSCAVSGGADSLALLVLAVAAQCSVTAIHVDHGLRPDSGSEADYVAAAADQVGAAFESRTVSVTLGANLEERARDARREVLPADVLLGHTADDQAETVLLNMMWGSGVRGLAAMPHDGRRPLMRLRRTDTERVCVAAGLHPLRDSMNDDLRFRRVRVRQELLPLMNTIADRDMVPVLCRQAEVMADQQRMLDQQAAHLDPGDCAGLQAVDPVVAAETVRAWLRQQPGTTVDRATVQRVLAVAAGDAVGTDVGGGWQIRRTRQRLRLVPPER